MRREPLNTKTSKSMVSEGRPSSVLIKKRYIPSNLSEDKQRSIVICSIKQQAKLSSHETRTYEDWRKIRFSNRYC